MANAMAEGNMADTIGGRSIVGVVGMMHLDGIERTLVNKHGYQVVSNPNCSVDTELADSNFSNGNRGYEAYDIPIIS